jgi:hypothetical protein
MATVKVAAIVSRVKALLQDDDLVRWGALELQYWLNDGYRELVNLRPDANTIQGEYVCSAGARQVLTSSFPNATRLISISHNTAATSNKYGVQMVSKSSLETQRRGWRAETPSVNIEGYMFDARTPREFEVYPPAAAAARLWALYVEVPAAHTLSAEQLTNESTAETIRVDDSFANALVDYILYRAYSKDGESGSGGKAAAYYGAFRAALGEKGQSEAASRPGVA